MAYSSVVGFCSLRSLVEGVGGGFVVRGEGYIDGFSGYAFERILFVPSVD